MGGCQNYGPILGTQNNRCRIIMGTQKGTIILTTTHMYGCAHLYVYTPTVIHTDLFMCLFIVMPSVYSQKVVCVVIVVFRRAIGFTSAPIMSMPLNCHKWYRFRMCVYVRMYVGRYVGR